MVPFLEVKVTRLKRGSSTGEKQAAIIAMLASNASINLAHKLCKL